MPDIDDFSRLKEFGLTPDQALSAQIMLSFKHTEIERIRRREKPLVDCSLEEIVAIAKR